MPSPKFSQLGVSMKPKEWQLLVLDFRDRPSCKRLIDNGNSALPWMSSVPLNSAPYLNESPSILPPVVNSENISMKPSGSLEMLSLKQVEA
jgi:hypothetical protein